MKSIFDDCNGAFLRLVQGPYGITSIPLKDLQSAMEVVKNEYSGGQCFGGLALNSGIDTGKMLVLAPHLLVADALLRACVNGDKVAAHKAFKNIPLSSDSTIDWTRATSQYDNGPQSHAEYVQVLASDFAHSPSEGESNYRIEPHQ